MAVTFSLLFRLRTILLPSQTKYPTKLTVIKPCHHPTPHSETFHLYSSRTHLNASAWTAGTIFGLVLTIPTLHLMTLSSAHAPYCAGIKQTPFTLGSSFLEHGREEKGVRHFWFAGRRYNLQMEWMEVFPKQPWKQNLGIWKNYCNLFLSLLGGGHSHLKGYWVYELLNRWVLEQRWVFYGGSHQKYGQLYKDVRELSKVKSTKKGNIMALVLWICKLRSECIITRWPLFHYMHFSISMFSFCPYASFLVFWHFFNSFTFLSFNLPLR